jgi:hypothetical protein
MQYFLAVNLRVHINGVDTFVEESNDVLNKHNVKNSFRSSGMSKPQFKDGIHTKE